MLAYFFSFLYEFNSISRQVSKQHRKKTCSQNEIRKMIGSWINICVLHNCIYLYIFFFLKDKIKMYETIYLFFFLSSLSYCILCIHYYSYSLVRTTWVLNIYFSQYYCSWLTWWVLDRWHLARRKKKFKIQQPIGPVDS